MRYLNLSPDQILPPVVPLRESLDERELEELADDIRARGIMVPLIVTREEHALGEERWRLVDGVRRLTVARRLGLVEVPCVEHTWDDVDQVTAMMAAQLHRAQAHPLDEGRVFAILLEGTGKTLEEVAKMVGKSTSYVGTRVRLLELPHDLSESLRQELINMSVALELAKVLHDEDRAFLLSHAVSSGATAETARLWVRDAIERRERMAKASSVEVATMPGAPPAVITCHCEWCRREVPLETTIAFRVCGDDFQFLQELRQQIAKDAAAVAAAGTVERS